MTKSPSKTGRKVAPGIWKLKKKSFIVRAQPVDPETGKPRNLRRVVHDVTLTEAKQLREELMATFSDPPGPTNEASEASAPSAPRTSTVTTRLPRLGDFAESWLERKIARGDLQEQTADRYATSLDRLSPRLQRTPLDLVTRDDVERWMIAARRRYSARTINGWRRVLRTVFNDAMAEHDLPRNPAALVRPLKVVADLEEPNAVSAEQLRRILAALARRDPMLHAMALTQALTGLRWQELSALHRADLDHQSRSIVIKRKAVRSGIVSGTKTGRARRIGLPRVLLAKLDAYLGWLDASQHRGRQSPLLFPSLRGTPLKSSRLNDALREVCAEAGVDTRLTSHGLRRTATDLLRLANVDPVVAKSIVGHATDRMREHYATLSAQEARDAGDRVERLVFGDEGISREEVLASE